MESVTRLGREKRPRLSTSEFVVRATVVSVLVSVSAAGVGSFLVNRASNKIDPVKSELEKINKKAIQINDNLIEVQDKVEEAQGTFDDIGVVLEDSQASIKEVIDGLSALGIKLPGSEDPTEDTTTTTSIPQTSTTTPTS